MAVETAVSWSAPSSLHHEFQRIATELDAAAQAPGRLGSTARHLVGTLEAHFSRQQALVLPPLGLLQPLSRRSHSNDMGAMLPVIDRLRQELPRLLDEHLALARELDELTVLAQLARRPDLARVSQYLGIYALMREQIIYPAALVAGDLLRHQLRHEPGY